GRGEWRRLEELLGRVEGSGLAGLGDEEAVEFGRLYRRASSDLNQAQTFVRGEETVRYLNDLVARAYLVLSAPPRVDLWGVARYLALGYPAVFRRNLAPFLLAAALFAGGAVFGYLASRYDRETARAYLLPAEMPTIQPPREGE